MNTTPTGEKVADLAATCLEKAGDVKARVGVLQPVSNVEGEALARLRRNEGHAGFDCVCDELKIFAGHVLLLCWGQLNSKHHSEVV